MDATQTNRPADQIEDENDVEGHGLTPNDSEIVVDGPPAGSDDEGEVEVDSFGPSRLSNHRP